MRRKMVFKKRTSVGDTPASRRAAAMVALWEVPLGAVSVALLPLCPTADPYKHEGAFGINRSEGGRAGGRRYYLLSPLAVG